MVAVTNKALRIRESREKICRPFELDETLCLYSPQDNVDALSHPRIVDWHRFITRSYEPRLPAGDRHILLFLPCTKTKPYPFSVEHKRINSTLISAGFQPTASLVAPVELIDALEPEFPAEVLNLSPLRDDRGTVVHRVVLSEPLGVVPYENIVSYESKPSPATAYDDPGLFENRGNAVSPWRTDFTATAISDTRWKWGDEERRGYVTMHNVMSEWIAAFVTRLAGLYTERIAWVAPGLTHRSFVVGRGERKAHRVPAFRSVGGARLDLIGANDRLPPDLAIECLPTFDHCRMAMERLAMRLGRKVSQVGGAYSRGGGNATPLALPELLETLVETLRRPARTVESQTTPAVRLAG
jgi:hypothetical protein